MPHSKQISFIVKISACLILSLIPISPAAVFSADVILTWDRPNDSRVTGYKIFYGFVEKDFKSSPKEIITDPKLTYCNIYNLIPGQEYLFAAKSYDTFGNESAFSEELSYIPPPESQNGSSDYSNNGDKKRTDAGENVNDHGDGGCFISVAW